MAAELVLLRRAGHHGEPDGLGHAGHRVEVTDSHPGDEVWRGEKRNEGGENRHVIVSWETKEILVHRASLSELRLWETLAVCVCVFISTVY